MSVQPQFPQTKPPLSVGDVVLSVVFLVAAAGVWAWTALTGLFALAFLDNCPPETCDADLAGTLVLACIAFGGLTVVGGVVLTAVLASRRVMTSPWALIGLVICIAILLVCNLGYEAVVR